ERESRSLIQPPLPPDEAPRALAAAVGVSSVGLRPPFVTPTAAYSHPDCRAAAKPDHKQMQFARLEPALRLAARGVAEGDAKAIPLLLKLVDRLDRYCEPNLFDDSPLLSNLVPRPKRRRRRGSAPQAGQAPVDRTD